MTREQITTDFRSAERIKSVRKLRVYRLAFDAAMEIYQITKTFPADEKYSLVDQIRRASRSVCSNLAEAWRKRKYRADFKHKLSDCSEEACETQTWLEFCNACGYLSKPQFDSLDQKYEHIYAMLYTMDRKAETFYVS